MSVPEPIRPVRADIDPAAPPPFEPSRHRPVAWSDQMIRSRRREVRKLRRISARGLMGPGEAGVAVAQLEAEIAYLTGRRDRKGGRA